MKPADRRSRWTSLLAAALLVAGALIGLGQARAWLRAQGLPASSVLLAAELELERAWHRLAATALPPAATDPGAADELQRRVRLGADWLLAMQEPGGRFHYWYRPDLQLLSRRDDDNFLRQAGTGYALALVAEQLAEPRYLEAAVRALAYQRRFVQHLDGDKAFMLFQGKAKLGGVALPMLTLLKRRELTGERADDELLRQLAAMILDLQRRGGGGRFKSTHIYLGDSEHERTSGWESQIYPGEAMLALAEMHRAFGDVAYREAVDRAMDYYGDDDRWRSHAFLSWTIAAMTSLHAQTGDVRYASFGLRLSDFLLTQQNLDPDDAVVGSFHAFPSANTATYLEGLAEGLRLAIAVNDGERAERYRRHLALGLGWVLRLQIDDAAPTLASDARARGGVRQSLHLPLLRIDSTQHALSAMVRSLQVLHEQAPGWPARDARAPASGPASTPAREAAAASASAEALP